jgi:predicted porin
MNKKLGLAVAGALLAASASAQAGITIPAGDWTLDVGGNVNAYYTHTSFSGGLESNTKNALTERSANTISTGLLPAALGIGGKTRQNDLDISFQFTFFTGTDSGDGIGRANGYNSLNIRQAYLTFGDASWGSVKMGRDLGVFGSDAILSDMTLLGVGTGAGGNGNSTLGRIGSGYLYADWVGQIQYTTPNWNGFQVTGALRQPWGNSANSDLGVDAKAVYSWTGDVAGKVWVGGLTQKTRSSAAAQTFNVQKFVDAALAGDTYADAVTAATTAASAGNSNRASAWEIGANVSVDKANFVAYYYDGKNMGSAAYLNSFLSGSGINIVDSVKDHDVKGGYVQATYVIPTGTKLGASWGQSKNESNSLDGANAKDMKSKSWIVGAYHPLTKSLNLVAEYTDTKIENLGYSSTYKDGHAKTVALGAILFF